MEFEIQVSSQPVDEIEPGILVDFLAEDEQLDGIDDDHPAMEDFEPNQGNTTTLYDGSGFPAPRWHLIGLGDPEDLEPRDAYELGGLVSSTLDSTPVQTGVVRFRGLPDEQDFQQALVTGICLGTYSYEEHKSENDDEDEESDSNPELESLFLLKTVDELDPDQAETVAESVSWSRDLANAPANDLTPHRMAEKAEQFRDELDRVEVEIWDEDRLAEEDMNLHLAVSKGSGRPGCLIQLTYEPDSPEASLGLAGKGVTFDTGGISIKPSKKMHEMKFDMCGAAAVLGYVRLAAELELPVRIEAMVPAVENMPGENATCPGDVIEGRKGKTVEIINTDAEGRLILADSLALLSEREDEFDLVVDMATLTGACIGALGHQAAGLMTPNEDWVEPFKQAGEATGDRVWPFPLWEEYDEQLESDTGDVKNIGGKPGSIIGGMFLQNFVDEDLQKRWVHLDIAGVGWGMPKKPHRPDGGTGYGVMLLKDLIERQFL